MTELKWRDAQGFLAGGFQKYGVILLFGPDEGLVNERAAAMARTITGDDPGNIMRLDGDEVTSDPLKLADEANAISMFGGKRAIRVRLGSKSIVPALEPLLATPPIDASIIIEAGDIKPNNAVRSLIAKSSSAASLGCYTEEARDLGKLAEDVAAAAGLRLRPDARQALIATMGLDRKLSRSELDKLTLYCRGKQEITAEDVDAIITDAAAVAPDKVIDAAFSGQLDALETEARRLFADGMDPGVLLGFALRHALLLQNLQTKGGGQNGAESIERSGVRKSRVSAVSDQMSRWTDSRLQRGIQIVGDAILNVRKQANLADALAIRALWSLALSAQRR
jgi:DNA polymerase III subunit delta